MLMLYCCNNEVGRKLAGSSEQLLISSVDNGEVSEWESKAKKEKESDCQDRSEMESERERYPRKMKAMQEESGEEQEEIVRWESEDGRIAACGFFSWITSWINHHTDRLFSNHLPKGDTPTRMIIMISIINGKDVV
ncbi:Hypothetical protein NTJ_03627 [Nesidiocoris tenuis]|uniref:Uncharacterized protein n=1 Tax=Nesidiocoris tenuis TaxID=355587 RepID=A0ABN7AEZ9_9HEMI|nr:Hypothetical protein NTJ_03627 [Nesidiocoris tenuis]